MVMSLCPGGRSFATGPAASTVALGEGDPLPLGEQSLLAADVERLAVFIEHDGDRSLAAGQPLDGLDRDGGMGALHPTVTGTGGQLLLGYGHPNRGRTAPE